MADGGGGEETPELSAAALSEAGGNAARKGRFRRVRSFFGWVFLVVVAGSVMMVTAGCGYAVVVERVLRFGKNANTRFSDQVELCVDARLLSHVS